MSQIVRIFRKDLRQHWPVLVTCFVAVIVYSWHEVHTWTPKSKIEPQFWAIATAVILPVSWFVVILRVVQADPLVGQRQFWITRPYEWKKLLAAKALFIVVSINVPMLIAGVFLLMRAGFSPAPYWLGLLWMQALLWVPLLPIVALAVVTSTLAEGLLGVLGFALVTAGMLGLDSLVHQSAMSSSEIENWLAEPLLVAGGALVIWIQYSMRRTALARLWFGVFAVVLLLISNLSWFMRKDHLYPFASDGKKAAFELSIGMPDLDRKRGPLNPGEEIELAIPVLVSGVQENGPVRLAAIRLTLEGADGFRWASDWESFYNILGPGGYRLTQNFKIDSKAYQKASAGPVKVEVSAAADVYRDGRATPVIIGNGEFALPGVGRCVVAGVIAGGDSDLLRCHAPLVTPPTLMLKMVAGASTCPGAPDPEADDSHFQFNDTSVIAEMGFSPVASFSFSFSRGPANRFRWARMCPGTPMLLSFPRLASSAKNLRVCLSERDWFTRP